MTESELNSIFSATEALFSKDSKEYQEQVLINKASKTILEDTQEMDPLTLAISQATHITPELKKRYLCIAQSFLDNMHDNILKDQFELNRVYPDITIDEWNDFLSDRIVATYIAKHKRTLLKAAAEFNLSLPGAKNKRDSLQLIKNIEDKEQGEASKNICIIRIPDIYDE